MSGLEELGRGRLERKVEEEKARNKAEMDSLRRDMVAWKEQAEKMKQYGGRLHKREGYFGQRLLGWNARLWHWGMKCDQL